MGMTIARILVLMLAAAAVWSLLAAVFRSVLEAARRGGEPLFMDGQGREELPEEKADTWGDEAAVSGEGADAAFDGDNMPQPEDEGSGLKSTPGDMRPDGMCREETDAAFDGDNMPQPEDEGSGLKDIPGDMRPDRMCREDADAAFDGDNMPQPEDEGSGLKDTHGDMHSDGMCREDADARTAPLSGGKGALAGSGPQLPDVRPPENTDKETSDAALPRPEGENE